MQGRLVRSQGGLSRLDGGLGLGESLRVRDVGGLQAGLVGSESRPSRRHRLLALLQRVGVTLLCGLQRGLVGPEGLFGHRNSYLAPGPAQKGRCRPEGLCP